MLEKEYINVTIYQKELEASSLLDINQLSLASLQPLVATMKQQLIEKTILDEAAVSSVFSAYQKAVTERAYYTSTLKQKNDQKEKYKVEVYGINFLEFWEIVQKTVSDNQETEKSSLETVIDLIHKQINHAPLIKNPLKVNLEFKRVGDIWQCTCNQWENSKLYLAFYLGETNLLKLKLKFKPNSSKSN